MRTFVLTAMMMLLTGAFVCAATVNLNDGHVLKGDIIKKDSKSLQINVDGIVMTYYADEIKDVDGQVFAPAKTAPAAKLPSPRHSVPVQAAVNAPTAPAPEVGKPAAEPEQRPSQGTLTDEKKALILKFVDVFGTRQALAANFEALLKQIDKEKPDEAQKIRDRVKIDEIIERLVPIYDRNFTSEDLKAFIAFYASDEGKKLISTIPELMKESVQESIKYMQEKFPEAKAGQ